MSYIVMFSGDEKSRSWAKASRQFGTDIRGLERLPILSPLTILWNLVTRGRPRGIVFRYLNDYPSFFKSITRLASEFVVVSIARLLRIRVAWICHNVDRETSMHHPKITRLRRTMIGRASWKIFVTDPALLPHAKRFLPEHKDKLDYVTFGAPIETPQKPAQPEWWERLLELAQGTWRSGTPDAKTMIGLSIGHASWKTVHYEQSIRLLDSAQRLGYELRLIIIGPIRKYLEEHDPCTLEQLRSDERIFLVDEYARIDEAGLAERVDFYWRAYRDYSVPYGLYHSAYLKKPVLAYGEGFLSEAVRIYSLGAVINEDFSNLEQSLQVIAEWDDSAAERFLATHTWSGGARQLLAAFDVELR